MSYLGDQIVYPIEQSSKLFGILYSTINVKNNEVERPQIAREQFVY